MAKRDFKFCPGSRTAETLAPEETTIRDFNGWDYTPNPVLPYRRKFKITLEGVTWYQKDNGRLDYSTNPFYNAGLLQAFYEEHRRHVPFNYDHEWMGVIELRFDSPINIPKAIPNSGGLVEPIEFTAVHHNPRYGQ